MKVNSKCKSQMELDKLMDEFAFPVVTVGGRNLV